MGGFVTVTFVAAPTRRGGLALFTSIIVFFLAVMHRLSGEDVSKVEGTGWLGLGG
jgi:hypothetical protein